MHRRAARRSQMGSPATHGKYGTRSALSGPSATDIGGNYMGSNQTYGSDIPPGAIPGQDWKWRELWKVSLPFEHAWGLAYTLNWVE